MNHRLIENDFIFLSYIYALFELVVTYIVFFYETELAAMQSRLEAEIIDQFHMCRTFATAKAETMAKVIDYIEDKSVIIILLA